MDSVSNTSGPSAAGLTGAAPPSHAIGPGDVLAYVSMMLNDIDSQLLAFKEEAEARNKTSGEIQELSDVIRRMQALSGEDEKFQVGKDTDPETRMEIHTKLYELATGASDAKVREAADEMLMSIFGVPTSINEPGSRAAAAQIAAFGGFTVNKEKMADALQQQTDRLSTLNKNNEFTMMEISQLTRQRLQVTQFSSNMIATMHDAQMSVIRNMRS